MFVKPRATPAAIPMDSVPGLTKVNQGRAAKGLPPVTGRGFKTVLQSVPDAKGVKRD